VKIFCNTFVTFTFQLNYASIGVLGARGFCPKITATEFGGSMSKYGAVRFSLHRWALQGEAAVFLESIVSVHRQRI
jgi:hypothetical protein